MLSKHRSAGILTKLLVVLLVKRVSIPDEGKSFFFCTIETCFGTHPVSYSTGTAGDTAGSVPNHPASTSTKVRSHNSMPAYVHKAWRLIKDSQNFSSRVFARKSPEILCLLDRASL